MKEVTDGRVSSGQQPPPSEGWKAFVVDENTKFGVLTSKEKGENYDAVSLQLKVCEGEEEGRRLFHTYFLNDNNGRTDFAKLLYFAKAAPTIEKNYKITDDLAIDEWAEKYLNPESEKCKKLIEGSIGVLIGRNLDGKVIVRKDKKTGNDRAYLNEVAFYGKGESKAGDKKASGKPAPETPAAPASSGEGESW